jgi:glutamyl-tRNA synthetase
MGYLSDAMVNYLLRLGWGHGDEEIISRTQAIEWFDLDAVGKAPAKFDPEKLGDLNAHYLRMMDDDSLYKLLEGHITPTSPAAKARVVALLPLLKERAKSHLDIAKSIGFLLHDGAPAIGTDVADPDAADILDETALHRLQKLMADAPNADWTVDGFQAFLKDWLLANEIKMKDIGIPLRVAVTGAKQSVSIVDVIVALGRDEVRLRVEETCKKQGFDV